MSEKVTEKDYFESLLSSRSNVGDFFREYVDTLCREIEELKKERDSLLLKLEELEGKYKEKLQDPVKLLEIAAKLFQEKRERSRKLREDLDFSSLDNDE